MTQHSTIKQTNTISESAPSSFLTECKDLFKLAVPIFAAQFCTQALALIDSIMAAQAGEMELAAVSLGCAFWSTIILLCLGIPFALAPITAQLKGSGAAHRIPGTVWNAFWPLSVITTFSVAILIFVPEKLLLAVGSEPDLAALTQKYLYFVAPAFPAIVLLTTIKTTFEGLTLTKPGMLVAFGGVLLNIPFNYYFINGFTFGPISLEPMGAAGCGAATTVVSWLGAVVMLLWCRLNLETKALGLLKQKERFSRDTVRLLCKTGLPISAAYIIETFSYSAIGYAAAAFGSRMVAAHQIANIICIMVFMLPIAMSSAIAIKTGYALGQGSILGVKRTASAGLIVSMVLILSSAVIVFALRHEIISGFTSVPETAAAALPLFICILVYQIQDSFYGTGLGILRGFRDNSTLLGINFVVLWLIVLPLGVWLGFYAPIGDASLSVPESLENGKAISSLASNNATASQGSSHASGYGIYGIWSALVGGYYLISICFWVRAKYLFKHAERYMGALTSTN